MPRTPSAAQRAVQVTFVLKGHLKNVQISYLRAATLLAKVRDERLYAALRHDSLESYASARLGLGRASLYRYLQIHDWAREFHPKWLDRKPKGFIPELTDAYALMWIDRRLADPGLDPELRRKLEAMRAKALAGRLSHGEFQKVQGQANKDVSPLRSLLSALRAARRRAARVGHLPAEILRDLDTFIARVSALAEGAARVGSLARRAAARA